MEEKERCWKCGSTFFLKKCRATGKSVCTRCRFVVPISEEFKKKYNVAESYWIYASYITWRNWRRKMFAWL